MNCADFLVFIPGLQLVLTVKRSENLRNIEKYKLKVLKKLLKISCKKH